MKRSEALWIIREYLTSANGSSEYCAYSADNDAEKCLKELEQAGMLPPEYPKQVTKSESPHRHITRYVKEWEPEE